MNLLNAIQAKVEEHLRGHMYMETIIIGEPLQVMLDTGTDMAYMVNDLDDKVRLSYTKERDFIKGVNAQSPWLLVSPVVLKFKSASEKVMLILPLLLWMTRSAIWASIFTNFLNMLKAFLMPYTNSMCIIETGQPYVVSVKWKINKTKMLSAVQFSKGIKRKEPTFRTTLKMKESKKGAWIIQRCHTVWVTQETSPRREVDHVTKLELEDKPLHLPLTVCTFRAWGVKEAIEGATWYQLHSSLLMNKVLDPFLDDFVIVYLDDIVTYSRTLEEYVRHLREVFQTLRDNELYVKKEKCSFA